MSKEKCSSKNPATCRYHGHEEQVAIVKDQQRQAEEKKDFEGYFNASKTLEALEKQRRIVAGLDSSLNQAREKGDFSDFLRLTDRIEKASNDTEPDKPAPKKRISRKPPRQLVGSDGNTYTNSLHPSFENGAISPERVFMKGDNGENMAFVRADAYSHNDYPDTMCIQASRPISKEEMEQLAQLTGYQFQKTLHGERMPSPQRAGDSSFLTNSNMRKAPGRKTRISDFENGLQETIQEGSDVRKTDKEGVGTKGTRLIEGMGDKININLYYRDTGVTFEK